MQRRSLIQAAGSSVTLCAAAPFVRAQGNLQKLKFNLGWKFEASGAGFLLAEQRGYYKDAWPLTLATAQPPPSVW
jgi:NitT/TauT family transport system substrate-binding protein